MLWDGLAHAISKSNSHRFSLMCNYSEPSRSLCSVCKCSLTSP